MRKSTILLGMLSVFGALVSCTQEIETVDNTTIGTHTVTVSAIQTKTSLTEGDGIVSFNWSTGDEAYFHLFENGVEGTDVVKTVDDAGLASFKATFSDTSVDQYVYSAGYYYTATKNGFPTVLSEQNPSLTSFDPAADVLLSVEDVTTDAPATDLQFSLGRPVSVNKMNLTGLTAGEKVSSVVITSNKDLTGTYDIENDEYAGGGKVITLQYESVEVPAGGEFPVYFICLPTLDTDEATTLSIKVTTDQRKYTKEISSDKLIFTRKQFLRFNVGLSDVPFFHETFDNLSGTGANDGEWNGNIASSTFKDADCDNQGWEAENIYAALKAVKLGGSSKKGTITTPALGINSETATLTFRAGAWDANSEKLDLEISIVGNGDVSLSEVTLTKAEFNDYEVVLGNGIDADTKVKISAKNTSNNRFFIDDILVEAGGDMPIVESLSVTPETADIPEVSYEGGTVNFTVSASNIDSWDAVSDNDAFVVAKTDGGFSVTVAPNASSVSRTATITVSGGSKSVEVQITQGGAPAAINVVTIAEFLAAEVNTTTKYQLTGKITSITNTTYGNFYMKDGTGEVFVYGLTSTEQSTNDKSFSSIGLTEGDKVTLVTFRAENSGTPEAGGTIPAYYVSHVPGVTLSVSPTSATVLASVESFVVNVTSNGDWTVTPGTGVSADSSSGSGNATVTLSFPKNTSDSDVERTAHFEADDDSETFADVTITQKSASYVPPTGWILTDISQITESDIFVIVGSTGGSTFAMPNNNGTASAPSTVPVTVADGKITSGVSTIIAWNLSGNATDGYTFYPVGKTDSWLYCNTTAESSSNNNIRVGTGNRKAWTLDSNNYLQTNDTYTKRYLSIYDSQDWRGYVNTNLCPAISFYVKNGDAELTKADPGLSVEDITVKVGETKSIGAKATSSGKISYEVTDGSSNIVLDAASGTVKGVLENTTATIKVSIAETDDYSAAEKEITVTVDPADNPGGDTGNTYTYIFTSKSWNATLSGEPENWTSGTDGNSWAEGQGIQVTTGTSGANGTSPVSYANVSKIVVTFNTNKSAGAGAIVVQVGDNEAVSKSASYPGGSVDGRSMDATLEYTFSPNQSGYIKVTVNTTTNSIWLKSVAITAD